jgi:hypothetical protein
MASAISSHIGVCCVGGYVSSDASDRSSFCVSYESRGVDGSDEKEILDQGRRSKEIPKI